MANKLQKVLVDIVLLGGKYILIDVHKRSLDVTIRTEDKEEAARILLAVADLAIQEAEKDKELV